MLPFFPCICTFVARVSRVPELMLLAVAGAPQAHRGRSCHRIVITACGAGVLIIDAGTGEGWQTHWPRVKAVLPDQV